MKGFIFKGELYIRCVPGKNLFKSTMVHEVVNRGDIFAIRVSDSQLTIVPGNSQVEHVDIAATSAPLTAKTPLETMRDELIAAIEQRKQRGQPSSALQVGDSFRPSRWRSTGRYQVVDIDDLALWCDYYDGSGEKRNRGLMPITLADMKEGYVRVN